jgi:cytidylate kinase
MFRIPNQKYITTHDSNITIFLEENYMAVITISRQFGAGGKTLGSLISQKLEYTLIDDAIINKVAEKAKVSKDWVQSIEKEAGGKLLSFISKLVSKSFIERILDESKGYIDEDVYIDTLKEVFDKFAEEDNCVILGRGGQHFLRNHDNVVHVLMVAEREDRIKFMEDHYNLLPTQARNTVMTRDKNRQTLCMKIGNENFENPGLYNIILNMSRLSMNKAAEIVCTLSKTR